MIRYLVVFCLFVTCFCFAAPSEKCTKNYRVAILDNPATVANHEWLGIEYERAYLRGIDVAQKAAKQKGICLNYKTFFYGKAPLAVLTQVPKVQAWHPDFIIGPHFSNDFLLLKNYFKDILVISPYPSDPAIYKMPKNFYSLSYPDSIEAEAMVRFIQTHFPERGIFNVVQIDCKDCVDSTFLFNKMYKEKNANAKIVNGHYIGNNIDNIDLADLIKEYRNNYIIIIQSANFSLANALIDRISTFLNRNNLVFINNLDNWGSRKTSNLTSDISFGYAEYRVIPWLFNKDDPAFKTYNTLFHDKYGYWPSNSVSYMSFLSVMAVLNSQTQCHPYRDNRNNHLMVLDCFIKTVKKNPNWFRPRQFAIYKYHRNEFKKMGSFNVDKSK